MLGGDWQPVCVGGGGGGVHVCVCVRVQFPVYFEMYMQNHIELAILLHTTINIQNVTDQQLLLVW